ncbi:membrane protein [Candidatus Thiomargarita nelsonii]|uniref:Membrane protein n=1 Tax=Candidatus Thiomargarita nelsonii TaxID=1003181 RepID=A0A176S1F3_9GAMM|nr:membrane protein [Candidatus Thiomargarita nelsonii]
MYILVFSVTVPIVAVALTFSFGWSTLHPPRSARHKNTVIRVLSLSIPLTVPIPSIGFNFFCYIIYFLGNP